MKKLFTLLVIGITFIGCEETEVGQVGQNQPPQGNCDCGKVISSSAMMWSGPAGTMYTAPYTTRIETNCNGVQEFRLEDRHYGDVCEWEVELFGSDGSHPNF